MSKPQIIIANGVRYRREDAERLKLTADKPMPAPPSPQEMDAAHKQAADIVAQANIEAAAIIAAANATAASNASTSTEGDHDGAATGDATGAGNGPGDVGGNAGDGPKTASRAKASK